MAEKVKFSVSVSAELGRALRECAEAEDEQISAVVSRALEHYLDDRRVIRAGLRAMDEHFDEHGWPTAEEAGEADAWAADVLNRAGEECRTA